MTPEMFFDYVDGNGDGVVDLAEVTNAFSSFDPENYKHYTTLMDANNDGIISRQEFLETVNNNSIETYAEMKLRTLSSYSADY